MSKSTYVQSLQQLINELVKELIAAQHESLQAVLSACSGIQPGDKFEDGIRNLLNVFSYKGASDLYLAFVLN